MSNKQVSELDEKFLDVIRADVSSFVEESAKTYDGDAIRVLDIAPQDHEGAAPYFKQAKVETLDIDPGSGADYIADICEGNTKLIDQGTFDVVVCTEVLEHVLQPFDAVKEIQRVLKPSGVVLVTTPFNFRIHGPLPDCWRFTEHGLRALFDGFDIVSLDEVEDENRFLMPIHYKLIARKHEP